MLKLFLPVLLLFSLYSFSRSCEDIVRQSYQKYEKKEYKAALTIFQTAIKNKCTLSNGDYYNGACFASLAKENKLALFYLKTSVEKGWDNTEHMAKDTDLDNIRDLEEYKKIVALITAKFDKMKAELSGLKPTDFNEAIPYTANGKWGWLDRRTNKPMTKAVFDFTDFKSGSGIYFIYGSKPYIWTWSQTINPAVEYTDATGSIGLYEGEPEIVSDPGFKGFTADRSRVTSFSNKFKSVTLINEWDPDEKIAVAADKAGKLGIIKEDGTVFKNFGFKYKAIDKFLGRFRQTYLIVMEINSDKYKVYDREGNEQPVEPFVRYHQSGFFERTPTKIDFFVGSYFGSYLYVFDGKKWNVLDEVTLEKIFPKSYDAIIMRNGPTSDKDRLGSPTNQGILEPYFLVSEGANMFYVDKKGKEFRAE